MLYTVAVALLVLWLLGFLVVPVGGSLIPLLLVIALAVIVLQFLSGRRGVQPRRPPNVIA